MIILMNSSKTLDFQQKARISKHTIPEHIKEAEILVKKLRKLSKLDFSKLMKVSEKLTKLNVERYAKKARGLMCNFIIQNHLSRIEELKLFDVAGYKFNESISSENEWVYTRGEPDPGKKSSGSK